MRKSLISLVVFILSLVAVALVAFRQPVSYGERYGSEQVFVKLETAAVIQKIQSKEAGLYYFGFETCPWCRELKPVLMEELSLSNQVAYNIDTKSEKFSEDAKQVVSDIYIEHFGGDRLYVPFLIAIDSQGEFKVHTGTVEGHNAKQEKMSDEEIEELRQDLKGLINHLG